ENRLPLVHARDFTRLTGASFGARSPRQPPRPRTAPRTPGHLFLLPQRRLRRRHPVLGTAVLRPGGDGRGGGGRVSVRLPPTPTRLGVLGPRRHLVQARPVSLDSPAMLGRRPHAGPRGMTTMAIKPSLPDVPLPPLARSPVALRGVHDGLEVGREESMTQCVIDGAGGAPPSVGVERHGDIGPLAREWEELADRVQAVPWVRPGWVAAWWRAFGKGALEVLAVRRGR